VARDRYGRFVSGPDADRHEFTGAERRRGYRRAKRRLQAVMGELEGAQWLLLRVRGWYRSRRPRA
jgi:hypothetical protein